MELAFEVVEELIARLEESDKALSDAVPRDKVMQAQTDIFFNLGIRDPELMKQGMADYASAMGEFKARLVQMVSEFRNGALGPNELRAQWKQVTGDYYERLFLAGAKSMGNPYYSDMGLTRKDAAFIARARRFEGRFFNKFLMDMQNPDFTPKMDFLDRAAAYAESGKAQFYNGMLAGAGDEVEIHWVMDNAAEHCGQCPILASKVWTWNTIPTTPGAGDTDCLFNCQCHLEIRPRKGLLAHALPPAPGAITAKPTDLPGRYATVLDANGAEMTGAILQDVEDLYKEMYKARQMIMVTDGEEKKEWIRIRKQLNAGIIDRVKAGGFKAIPTVSVTNLEQVVNWAKQTAPGGVITDLSLLKAGMEVVYIKSNYWTKGVVDLRGGTVVIKTPAGDRWTYDDKTDILMSMLPLVLTIGGEAFEAPGELMTIREFLEGVKDLEAQMEGGPGSGNFGHVGRPGERGGSAPEGGGDQEMGTDAQKDWGGMKVDAELKDSWLDRMNNVPGIDVISSCAGHLGKGQELGGSEHPGLNFRLYSVRDEATAEKVRAALEREGTEVETHTWRGPAGNWVTHVNGVLRSATFSKEDAEKYPIDHITFSVHSKLSNSPQTGQKKIDDWWEKTLTDLEGIPALLRKKESIEEGGAGSGNFGHAGIPGHQGGSSPEGGGGEPSNEPAGGTSGVIIDPKDPNQTHVRGYNTQEPKETLETALSDHWLMTSGAARTWNDIASQMYGTNAARALVDITPEDRIASIASTIKYEQERDTPPAEYRSWYQMTPEERAPFMALAKDKLEAEYDKYMKERLNPEYYNPQAIDRTILKLRDEAQTVAVEGEELYRGITVQKELGDEILKSIAEKGYYDLKVAPVSSYSTDRKLAVQFARKGEGGHLPDKESRKDWTPIVYRIKTHKEDVWLHYKQPTVAKSLEHAASRGERFNIGGTNQKEVVHGHPTNTVRLTAEDVQDVGWPGGRG